LLAIQFELAITRLVAWNLSNCKPEFELTRESFLDESHRLTKQAKRCFDGARR